MVRKLCFICLASCLCGLVAGIARADTFELSDGRILSGEIVSYDENGLVVREPDETYSDRVPWTRFSQGDLKRLADNPKIEPFIEPFIEVSEAEKLKKSHVDIKPVPRLERPRAQPFFAAFLSSGLGLAIFLALYVANVYAAYEISLFRLYPIAPVCGLAAVPLLGFLVPIVLLLMPTRVWRRSPERKVEPVAPVRPAPARPLRVHPSTAEEAAHHPQGGLRLADTESIQPASAPTQTQVFQRGAFTFNRRFFETRFPGFFGIVRRDMEKSPALVIKSIRGEYVGQRITRIAANDLHLQVQKGPASEEVVIPFVEIQEVQLQHREP